MWVNCYLVRLECGQQVNIYTWPICPKYEDVNKIGLHSGHILYWHSYSWLGRSHSKSSCVLGHSDFWVNYTVNTLPYLIISLRRECLFKWLMLEILTTWISETNKLKLKSWNIEIKHFWLNKRLLSIETPYFECRACLCKNVQCLKFCPEKYYAL